MSSLNTSHVARRVRWSSVAASLATVVALFAFTGSANGDSTNEKQNDRSQVVTWEAPPPEESTALAAVAPTQKHLEFVAFSIGCRFLDTRIAGGSFAADESRDLGVRDASLPAGLGPCGVPARAKAVQLSLSTIALTPTGIGFARLGPGGVAPTATVLQFVAGQGATVTTSATLDASGRLRLASYSAGAGFVGDLLGYWQEPVWGRVTANGTLSSGSGVLSITKSTAFAGDYYIYIDRTVMPYCVPAIMLESNLVRAFGFVTTSSIYVDVREYLTNNEADGAFNFILQCSQ